MSTEKPIVRSLTTMRSDLLRGDSVFAFIIFVVVGIFLVNMVISVWHNILFERDLNSKAGVQNARSIGRMLARSAEALLTTNEISMLRRTVVEAGVEYKLKSCRVVLPDGGVIADVNPSGITVIELPQSWSGQPGIETEKLTRDSVTLGIPLSAPGKGVATLEIAAETSERSQAGLEQQTAQLAIGCLALATMLLIHRHARFRLKAIGAVQDALLSMKEGESDVSALQLDPKLGLEAVVWNKLVGERQGQQIRTAIEQVKQSIDVKCEIYRELAAAYDALPHGLILVDGNMRAEYANGAAGVLLQTSKSELTNAEISRFISDQQVIAAIRKATEDPTFERVTVETQTNAVHQSGSLGSLDTAGSDMLRFSIRPIRGEDMSFTMVLIEDITQQRVAEAARGSFTAKAAHELRSPLANIRLYVENAIEQCQRDPAGTAKSLDVINEESRRLERVVSEILSVSEIEAGSLKLRRDDVSLGTLLEQLKADYTPRAGEKQISLEFNLPPKLPIVHADRDKIALALQNLLGNAVKYTQQNGRVVLDAVVEKGQIRIDVSDTGIGIGGEDLDKIFEKFYRAKDERVANIVGSGLGLAIAREVIRLHGGDITVKSELNKGSTFTLTLPIPEEAS